MPFKNGIDGVQFNPAKPRRDVRGQTIKYNPAKSILKLQLGEQITLTESDFVRLFTAFFAEIGTKFT